MKFENEPGFAAQSPPRKSYNPFESDDEDTNGSIRNYINTYGIKTFEKNTEALGFDLDNGDISWEEAILGHSPTSTPDIPADINGDKGRFREDSELFTDKTITECELPELIHHQENSYQSIKDIGIDEGLPTNDKHWVKSRENGDMGVGNKNRALPYIDDSKSMSEKNNTEKVACEELKLQDLGVQHSSNPFENGKGDEMKVCVAVSATNDHQSREVDEENHVKVDKKENGNCGEEHDIVDVPLEHVKESITNTTIMDSHEAITEFSESQKKESTLPQSLTLPEQQESTGDLCFSSKVESKNSISDSNSSSVISEKEAEKVAQNNTSDEKPQESQAILADKPLKAQTMSRHEDGPPVMDRWANGETSFSSALPPPASITYMGPNAQHGSISLRSESSTGSTRSFAFPVLQAEWNSSPVRMAKADRRHLRKHRGWVYSLICCKF